MNTIPNLIIPMRDGARLAADVYLPSEPGPVPALLHRTPYGKQTPLWIKWANYFAERGYAVVVQDVRGRWESDGEWYPLVNEGPDGFDTIEWIASQPWCDGSVGMYGASYGGWTQWAAARERPKPLRTMVSTAAVGRWFQEMQYYDGIFRLESLQWLNLVGGRTTQDNSLIDWRKTFEHLPLRTIDQAINRPSQVWQDWLDHSTYDAYWREIRLDDDFPGIDLPVLHITGWFDGDQPGALFFYRGMMSSSPAAAEQSLVIGPWDHAGTRVPHRTFGPLQFGESALVDVLELHVQWFDRHLRMRSADPMPRVRYFVMGPNEWLEDQAWPPATSAAHDLYLADDAGSGRLSEAVGDPASQGYTYDPRDPVRVPRDPDRQYRFTTFFETREDDDIERSGIECRSDVLVFETVPLEHELVVAGRSWLELFAESDCVDTDWIVWLSDHWPDGRSIVVAQGQLGARFRDSLEHPEPLVPGEVYRFRIELSEVAYAFPSGHRVSVAVTSSCFPLFARNPNTGAPLGGDDHVKVARNRVHLGRAHPSRLELPVLMRARLGATSSTDNASDSPVASRRGTG